MSEIKDLSFVMEVRKICKLLYDKGWDERNGGNISVILDSDEVGKYLDLTRNDRVIELESPKTEMAGKVLIITATGSYFKNIYDDPERNLGIIRVADDGASYSILWGYEGGGRPTSETSTHLLCHGVRLQKDPNHRVVMHCHATNVIAMSFVVPLTDRDFSRALWQMCTESMYVFPEGIGVLKWMVCGSDEIGFATAEKIKDYRMCVWAQHGIFGTGSSIDEAFGLIETAEKSAEIYMKIAHLPILQTITDDELRKLANDFNLTNARLDFLD